MKSGSLVRIVWAVAFVAPVALAAAPRSADACGTAVYREIDNSSQLVAAAEQALSEGKLAKAAQKAVQAYPALKIVKPGATPLSDRALRIMALAATRADGGLTIGTMHGTSVAEREANLEWSVETLKKLNEKRANNPSIQTDMAEAMAKVPKYRDEALKILTQLSDKDLLTSAEGYAALARLKAASGDAPGKELAVKRCETMSKTPSNCAVPSA